MLFTPSASWRLQASRGVTRSSSLIRAGSIARGPQALCACGLVYLQGFAGRQVAVVSPNEIRVVGYLVHSLPDCIRATPGRNCFSLAANQVFWRSGPLLAITCLSRREASKKRGQWRKVMSQGIEFNRLMLEMRSMQTEAMARPKPAASAQEVGAPSFSDMLGQAVGKVNETQQASSQLAAAFEVGKSGIDLTDVMIASQKASVSFQAVTQVRNKLVQAYQDIMQMPV